MHNTSDAKQIRGVTDRVKVKQGHQVCMTFLKLMSTGEESQDYMGHCTGGQEVMLGVSMDTHGAWPHRVCQDVDHREGSTHEPKAQARD